MIQILRPSAVGDQNTWTLIAGASKQAAVDPGDPISHTDGTYIQSPGTGGIQSFQVNTVPGGIDSINLLKIGIRISCESSDTISGYPRFTTTNGGSVSGAPGPPFTTYGPSSVTRPGGGLYVPGDFVNNSNATQIACNSNDVGGADYASSLWGELDFNPVGGLIVLFVAQYLGPIVAAGLQLRDMARIAAELWKHRELLIQPHEYALALEELRNHPYRSYHFRPASGLFLLEA